MMNAHEARSITNAAQSLDGNYKRNETNAILASVETAAAKGESKIYVYTSPYNDPVIVKRLQALDYHVSITDDQRDGWSMTVSW
jgi:hypothetical protein